MEIQKEFQETMNLNLNTILSSSEKTNNWSLNAPFFQQFQYLSFEIQAHFANSCFFQFSWGMKKGAFRRRKQVFLFRFIRAHSLMHVSYIPQLENVLSCTVLKCAFFQIWIVQPRNFWTENHGFFQKKAHLSSGSYLDNSKFQPS